MNDQTQPKLRPTVTTQEVAEALNVSVRQVYRWAAEGIIPCRKVSHKVLRFYVDEVQEWLDGTRRGPGRAA